MFGGKPSQRLGILCDSTAYAFDVAAAWRLFIEEQKRENGREERLHALFTAVLTPYAG